MVFRHRVVFLTGILAIALFATGCPQRETISRINADPGQYSGKEVTVAGTVTDSYGLLNFGVYEIDDGTGRLLVVTRRGQPSRGARVGVKGRVQTAATYGGRSLGTVLEETGRRVQSK